MMNAKYRYHLGLRAWLLVSLTSLSLASGASAQYVIVDTGQDTCYGNSVAIANPATGNPFYGQDAQYYGNQPNYVLSGDGLTVYDSNTGLTWQRTPDTDDDGDVDSDDKLTWNELQMYPDTLNARNFGGHNDWRIATIKELYSLVDFSGIDPSGYTGGTSGLVPFIDTDYFDFAYGDQSVGERIIDAQYWSSTQYVGTIFNGDAAVFGFNFADGRIKGYPRDTGPGGTMTQFVRCVRGNTDYGINDFIDNGDGTVTDRATGLMWLQNDNGAGLNWEDALAYAEGLSFAGHDDWRLPNAKELQSTFDYARSPSTHGSPAIDPVFNCTPITDEGGSTNYPFYWSSTTHVNLSTSPGSWGVYMAFGEALGYMQDPFPPFNVTLMDVHGAGAQRSDPKNGDPADWPTGNGPQGDVVRIYNYVRAVRDVDVTTGMNIPDSPPLPFSLHQNYPNPFNPSTTIAFTLHRSAIAALEIYNASGAHVRTLFSRRMTTPGVHSEQWDGMDASGRRVASGIFFYQLKVNDRSLSRKMLLLK